MHKFYLTCFAALLFSKVAFATTFVVTNTADTGAGSLRKAISDANADNTATAAVPHIINFQLPGAGTGNITLGSVITVTNHITIHGFTGIDVTGNNVTQLLIIQSGQVKIDNLTFRNGGVYAAGAVEIITTAPVTIDKCVFHHNNTKPAVGGGGGIYVGTTSNLTLLNSTLYNNFACDKGGAIDNEGVLTAINCSINSNSTTGHNNNVGGGFGDGIYTAGNATIINCTIANNNGASATSVGILTASGTATTIKNSIILGHASDFSLFSNINVNYSIYSVINIPGGSGATAIGSNNVISTNTTAVFGGTSPLVTNNGGPTPTIALISTSPAINAADATGAPITDERGYSRPDIIDIGSYEFNGIIPPPPKEINVKDPSAADIADGGTTAFGTFSLTGAITKVYTIENTGTATLTLTGAPGLSGSTGFSIVSFPAVNTTIAAGANTTFSIKFDPSGLARGTQTGTISFANDDADENPYNIDFAATIKSPEVNVKDGVTDLASGDTDLFTTVGLNGTTTKTLTLENTGNLVLNLSSPVVSGTGFTLLSTPTAFPGTTAAISSSSVYIKFDGAGLARGTYPGTLTFTTDDEDETTYTTNLSANVKSPEVNVKDATTDVSSGGKVTFPAILLNGNKTKVLTIENTGNITLNLSGTLLTGSGFSISGAFPSTVAANSTATVSLYFDGNSLTPGTYAGNLSFTTDDADENSYNIDLEIAVQSSEIGVKDASNANVSDGATAIDLGIFNLTGSVTQTFTIENTGAADLTLGAASLPTGSANGYSIINFPAGGTIVTPGNSTSFDVKFNASGIGRGIQSGSISFVNDDADENPFDISFTAAIQSPEINIQDNGADILTGGTSTFTAVNLNGTISKVFTIQNTGNSALNISGVSITSSTNFTLVSGTFPSAVAAGSSMTFTVKFDGNTLARGNYGATLNIISDDVDEATYAVNLAASVQSPEVNVKDGTTDISSTDKVILTAILLNANTSKALTIENTGNSPLNLSNPILSGNGGFTLTGIFPSTVGANSTASFTIKFDGAGLQPTTYAGVLTFNTDDVDESSYVLNLEIAVASPEIAVKDGSTDITDNGKIDFGVSETATDAQKHITILNTGILPLSLSNPVVSGAGYSLTGLAFPSTVDPGKSATFDIAFITSGVGTYPGKLTFTSNDPDEGVYIINFTIVVVDTKPPVIVELFPANNSTQIPITQSSFSIKFNEAIMNGTGSISIRKYYDNTVVFATGMANATVSFQNNLFTWSLPQGLLIPNEFYYLTLDNGSIKDAANNAFVGIIDKEQWTFSTELITVMLPTLFTPNQDGKDDAFTIDINNINTIDVKIYDRNGNIVYKTSSVTEATTNGWDGTKNGINQPAGAYVWKISGSFVDGRPLNFSSGSTGIIRLLR